MAFTKITDEDRQGKGNVGQPDTPLLTTTEMQEQMDSLPNLAIDGLNRLVDELTDSAAAQQIGMVVPPNVTASPNIYSVINALAILVTACNFAKHTHTNKTVLDTITTDQMEGIATFLQIFGGVDEVQSFLESDPSAIPTSEAVAYYVAHFNYKTIIRDALYPIGAVYQTTTIKPDTVFGTTGCWTLLGTDANGVKSYKRTS